MALISIVDFEAAADVWSALGAAMLRAFVVFESSSLLAGAAGFAEISLEADRWGIFLMSLYFAWLLSSCQHKNGFINGRSESVRAARRA
jgi:hypothetical protein